MYSLKELQDPNQPMACIDGDWVPARPLDGPFWWRVKDAWEVFRGRADAFAWPKGQ